MNLPVQIDTASLPSLIQRAADALLSAKTHADVLVARDLADVAYTAAKTAGRIARAKQAHDTLLAEVYRAQADALQVEALAKIRLAEEYDAAQERGEVAGTERTCVGTDNAPATAADLGLRRDQIHEARRLRDAEAADPGVVERTLDGMVERGESPTKAKLGREIRPTAPKRVMDPRALWLWGRLKDFERVDVLTADPAHLLAEMTEPMRADVADHLPRVRAWLKQLEAVL